LTSLVLSIFFFSSRRRHTRSKRDWSSDVCSSDLPANLVRVDPDGTVAVAATDLNFPNGAVITPDGGTLIVGETTGNRCTAFTLRSEERRVGKEGRSRRAADH